MKPRYNFSLLVAVFISATLNATEQTITVSEEPLQSLGTIVLTEIAATERFQETPTFREFLPIPHDLPVNPSELLFVSALLEESAQRVATTSPLPTRSFQALDDSLTTIPPDTMGAVGVNHLMTTLNDRIRIQTKTGITLLTMSTSQFWARQAFDPRITYDPFNNRWIFTSLANGGSASSLILIAVSQTSDPTAGWNKFALRADSSSATWADFPSLGFNGKWVVVQTNMFSVSTGAFIGSHIYVFNKASLYNNTFSSVRFFNLTGFGATQAPANTYDNVNPTLYLLQNWNGNFGNAGYLRLYAINGAIGAETLSALGFIAITSPWASFASAINGGFAPQLNSTRRIDNGDSRILSILFRNGSLWAAQTVFLPAAAPTHAGIQWFQISPTGAIQQTGRIVDPFANLTMGTFFAYPSIAVNNANDAVIGYSFFSPLIYATSGYSFRSHTDPANIFRATTILRNGLDIYTKDFGSGTVRWGDYSNTMVDPNGNDFWTIQESADLRTANGTTRWVTWWGLISAPPLSAPLDIPLGPLSPDDN